MENNNQTSDEAVNEIAQILALGVLRLRQKAASQADKAVDFRANGSIHADQEVPHEQ